MDFVAIDTDIAGDRVTYGISSGAKVSRREAVGILTLFFAGVACHADDGNLSNILDAQIEDWCLWDKKPGTLAPLLRSYLCDAQGVVINWDRWNGAMIRKAKADRERKRAARLSSPASAERPRTFHGQSADNPRSGAGTVPDTPDLTTTTPLLPKQPAKVAERGGWPAKVAEAWTRRIGVVQPGRVGKDLAAVVRLYPDAAHAERALLEAVTQYDASCTRKGQKPAWADFVRGVMNHVPQTMLPPERAA